MRKINLSWNIKYAIFCIVSLAVITGFVLGVLDDTSTSDKVVTVSSVDSVKPAEEEMVDISYEDMRVYVFPNNEMLIIKNPMFLKYASDGGHLIITIDENKVVKATRISKDWYFFTIYCKAENIIPNFKDKEDLKKKGNGFGGY